MKVSLVFDDGFIASCLRVADIFEARKLSATYAVLVNHDGFMTQFPKGDFKLWNELQQRGHNIHPHGWDHADLTALPFKQATAKTDACLDYFAEHLDGFDAAKSVYHFTYNRSTVELEQYLLGRVAAVRTQRVAPRLGDGMHTVQDLSSRVVRCTGYGPNSCDQHLLTTLQQAERIRPHLLVYMLHGLDGEGWGPLSSKVLESVLDRLSLSEGASYVSLSSAIEVSTGKDV